MRKAINPGISFSAIDISFRPHSANEISAEKYNKFDKFYGFKRRGTVSLGLRIFCLNDHSYSPTLYGTRVAILKNKREDFRKNRTYTYNEIFAKENEINDKINRLRRSESETVNGIFLITTPVKDKKSVRAFRRVRCQCSTTKERQNYPALFLIFFV